MGYHEAMTWMLVKLMVARVRWRGSTDCLATLGALWRPPHALVTLPAQTLCVFPPFQPPTARNLRPSRSRRWSRYFHITASILTASSHFHEMPRSSFAASVFPRVSNNHASHRLQEVALPSQPCRHAISPTTTMAVFETSCDKSTRHSVPLPVNVGMADSCFC